MNKEEFIGLSLNPNSITNDNLISLESILEEYPYFQTAQVLHLKGLKNQRSFKYNNALKKVAAYTTNRTVLFDFITSDVLDYEEKAKSENDILLDIDVVDSNIIEHIHKSIATQDNKQVVKELIDEVEKPIETIKIEKELEIGLPINFSKNDEFSFNEWLDFTPQKQIKRKKEENKGKKTTKKAQKSNKLKLSDQVNLIENFITKKPKIETSKTQEVKDIAIESVEENTSIMTETLARVYLEQKKYDKAISAFKILSLKYPEKSSFFADRINAIKILQKHKL
ncbi:MAG TPA: hypothetical protein EYP87_05055 [Flavobacteriaceae bacterium]|nr:hypothetical protein [Flavobacteriaceae bacterium]